MFTFFSSLWKIINGNNDGGKDEQICINSSLVRDEKERNENERKKGIDIDRKKNAEACGRKEQITKEDRESN